MFHQPVVRRWTKRRFNIRPVIHSTLIGATILLGATHLRADAFTYQGILRQNGATVDGTCDFTVTLWDAVADGNSIGNTVELLNTNVEEGAMVLSLDFGNGVFDGNPRWIEISVRHPAGQGSYTLLTPRQEITPAPIAQFAISGNEGPPGVQGDVGPVGPQGPTGPAGSDSLWTTVPPHMYFHTGHVGIGKQNPDFYLDVGRPARFDDAIGVGRDPLSQAALAINKPFNGNAIYAENNSPGTATIWVHNQGEGRGLWLHTNHEATQVGGGAIQIGPNENRNMGIDRNEITTRNGVNPATLNLNPHGGSVSVGVETGDDSFGQLRVQQQEPKVFAIDVESSHATLPTVLASNTGGGPVLWAQGSGDASLTEDGVVMVGDKAAKNVVIDDNEIMARENGEAATLHLNADGGDVRMGPLGARPPAAFGLVRGNTVEFLSRSSNVLSVTRQEFGFFTSFSVSVEGIQTGDIALVTPAAFAEGDLNYAAWVSGETIQVRFSLDSNPWDPDFNFVVFRP